MPDQNGAPKPTPEADATPKPEPVGHIVQITLVFTDAATKQEVKDVIEAAIAPIAKMGAESQPKKVMSVLARVNPAPMTACELAHAAIAVETEMRSRQGATVDVRGDKAEAMLSDAKELIDGIAEKVAKDAGEQAIGELMGKLGKSGKLPVM